VFPGPEFSRQPFPDLRDSGCPSGGFSAALLYELSADAFDAVIHAWMSELPIAAEIIRFAWNVIAAAREEVFQGGPPGTEPPDHPGLWPEPAAGADVPAGSAALYGPVWTALPEARRGAEKAAASRGDPDVRRVLEAAYKVRRETDRLRGLLRFNPCPRNGVSGGIPGAAAPSGGADSGGGAGKSLAGSSGDPVYIARCSPDHYILPGLADHFTRRFGECPWAVIDEKRDLVLAREPGGEARIFPLIPGWFPVPGGPGHQTDSGDPSDGFEDLWRNYHHSINNPDRNNPALQRQFLPRRYRKYLPELQ
jgi:probable DNA metabolism protein